MPMKIPSAHISSSCVPSINRLILFFTFITFQDDASINEVEDCLSEKLHHEPVAQGHHFITSFGVL